MPPVARIVASNRLSNHRPSKLDGGELLLPSVSGSQRETEVEPALSAARVGRVASVAPSGENATDQTHGALAMKILAHLPSLMSQRRTDPPQHPEASDDPEGQNAIVDVGPSWPSKSVWLRSRRFHKRIDSSPLPDARMFRLGEKETHSTSSAWPSKRVQLPFLLFQSRTIPSAEPQARHSPSGENATEMTGEPTLRIFCGQGGLTDRLQL
jgi:hypothetical protein